MKLTQGKIADLLNEPGCEHNHKKEKGKNKACTQQAKPGAAQGGCAFDGASIALVPITDAAHLVHGERESERFFQKWLYRAQSDRYRELYYKENERIFRY